MCYPAKKRATPQTSAKSNASFLFNLLPTGCFYFLQLVSHQCVKRLSVAFPAMSHSERSEQQPPVKVFSATDLQRSVVWGKRERNRFSVLLLSMGFVSVVCLHRKQGATRHRQSNRKPSSDLSVNSEHYNSVSRYLWLKSVHCMLAIVIQLKHR